mmetsp:Transcript_5767/g.5587  ORF Transcript_5767/g.5587 Transcript_5767/m.5587 type:complete len:83 (+) Transcript_5767:424-672(+)
MEMGQIESANNNRTDALYPDLEDFLGKKNLHQQNERIGPGYMQGRAKTRPRSPTGGRPKIVPVDIEVPPAPIERGRRGRIEH